jgi:serine/threonine-protein kinase RsbW
MPILSQIVLPAKLESLQGFLTMVSHWTREQGFSDQRISEIELAVEEALVNIFHYAYPEGAGTVELILKTEGEDRILLEIMDTGIPYNPLTRADPDTVSDVMDRKVGGLGVYFIKTLMNEALYKRDRDKNTLTLVAYRK